MYPNKHTYIPGGHSWKVTLSTCYVRFISDEFFMPVSIWQQWQLEEGRIFSKTQLKNSSILLGFDWSDFVLCKLPTGLWPRSLTWQTQGSHAGVCYICTEKGRMWSASQVWTMCNLYIHALISLQHAYIYYRNTVITFKYLQRMLVIDWLINWLVN